MTLHIIEDDYSNYDLFCRNLRTDQLKEKCWDLRKKIYNVISFINM